MSDRNKCGHTVKDIGFSTSQWGDSNQGMNRKCFIALLISLILPAMLISGCETDSVNNEFISPENVPLSTFIIGRWGRIETEFSDRCVEYTFEDENVVKIWTGDGTTCKYSFIDTNIIMIDCRPRALDLSVTELKRDGQFLLISNYENKLEKFERITGRNYGCN